MDVLYLDLDGVTHPAEVWYDRDSHQARLKAPGHELFESLPVLEAAIAPYPNLKIVLSTSWVPTFGFEKTRAFLPESLQSRVIGSTYDPQSPDAWRFAKLRRYDAIALDVQSRRPLRWLAIDDNGLGWPVDQYDALVLTPPALGLACIETQVLLRGRLVARFP
jgi:hypothetical protein